MADDMADDTALHRAVDAYERCWNERRFRDLRQLWPDADTMPVWLPEEVDRPLTDWPALEAYWRACEELIDRMAIRTWDRRFKPIAPGVACGVWMMRWTADTWYGNPPRRRALAGDVKVTAVFREDAPGDWRFVQYHEAALGPLPFVRRVYEGLVDPDWSRG